VVRLEAITGQGQDHENLGRKLAEVDRALGVLSGIKVTTSAGGGRAPSDGLDPARRVNTATERTRTLQEELGALVKEQGRVRDWGTSTSRHSTSWARVPWGSGRPDRARRRGSPLGPPRPRATGAGAHPRRQLDARRSDVPLKALPSTRSGNRHKAGARSSHKEGLMQAGRSGSTPSATANSRPSRL
jgi:hypothetical protein